ncbi:MAG: hypothetical protein OEY29_13065 [Gammaproteobacteria bacterium]|nr:hypothetical protein [Gammaproteobacteria bacterium]
MKRIKLGINEIDLGEPLLWSVYGSNGQLLLRQGRIIDRQEVIDKVFQHDPMRNAEMIINSSHKERQRVTTVGASEQFNPFNEITRFATRYRNISRDIENQNPFVNGKVLRLAEDIQSLVQFDEDACLGAIHFYYDQTYTSLQPIYKAILCELTAALLDYDAEQRLPLLAAAITSNIGLLDIQEKLNNQSTPLSEEQKKAIESAPAKAVEMLKTCNIDNTQWLKCIIENHERGDGSGYPWGLKSKHISPFAKILGIADCYVAMIARRAYREPLLAQNALRTISQMSSESDQMIYRCFISQLGAFPPGTLVTLNNNEVAVVTYRGFGNSIMGAAMSIGNTDGSFYATPLRRDTSLEAFKIIKIYNPKTKPRLNPDRLWSYS